eukprot:9110096-Pyramimonas_sp.AAC.2
MARLLLSPAVSMSPLQGLTRQEFHVALVVDSLSVCAKLSVRRKYLTFLGHSSIKRKVSGASKILPSASRPPIGGSGRPLS